MSKMRLTRIVADETSNLEDDFIKRHQVTVIPFNLINRNGRIVKITSDQKENSEEGLFRSKDSFFTYINKVKKKEDIPTSGAISIERIRSFIKKASQTKRDLVCIHLPKELSKITENVERAAELVSAEVGNKIKVVDSRLAFSAQYLVVKEAAELAEKGKSAEEIIEHLSRIRKNIHLFAAVYSLRYLRKSGRVQGLKKIASYISDFLGFSSIITLKEGVPELLATAARQRVENRILSEMERVTGYGEKISVRINYAIEETRRRTKKLEELIRKRFEGRLKEISSFQMGPLVGSHTGPYTISVAVKKHGYEELDSFVIAEMFERVAKKLKRNESTLNRLNIYPVIDADTGKNLFFTMSDVAKSVDFSSIRRTFSEIASRACENGTGFSGTSVAAYLTGFASCLSKNEAKRLDAENFVKAMEEGKKSAYLSFRHPREGTILSVMRVSAAKAREKLQEEKDIAEILKEAYTAAVEELLNPELQEIPILKRKGIVDAGGLGFVYTLEGWLAALGKEREIEDFIEEFRNKISVQKYSLVYKIEEAKHPGFCLKIRVGGLKKRHKDKLAKKLEALPNPIESPLSSISNIVHIHVYNEELKEKVLEICNKYGEAELLKVSPLSQTKFELLKNKAMNIMGKTKQIPKLVAWSLYWFGLRIVFPFREIYLWKQSRDLNLVTKGLEDVVDKAEQAIIVFNKKRKIKYFNEAAEKYVGSLGIERIKKGDKINLYLHPEFLEEVKGKLFTLGKESPYEFEGKHHGYELKQLYTQEGHIGAKLEIKNKRM
jgi:DegV family protein with EDD domain